MQSVREEDAHWKECAIKIFFMLKCVHANKHLIWLYRKKESMVVTWYFKLFLGNYTAHKMNESALLSTCEVLPITHS